MSKDQAQLVGALRAAHALYRDARNAEARGQAAVRLFRAVDDLERSGSLGVLEAALTFADALTSEGSRPV